MSSCEKGRDKFRRCFVEGLFVRHNVMRGRVTGSTFCTVTVEFRGGSARKPLQFVAGFCRWNHTASCFIVTIFLLFLQMQNVGCRTHFNCCPGKNAIGVDVRRTFDKFLIFWVFCYFPPLHCRNISLPTIASIAWGFCTDMVFKVLTLLIPVTFHLAPAAGKDFICPAW